MKRFSGLLEAHAMRARKFASRLLIACALTIATITPIVASCPDDQEEKCAFGACICVPTCVIPNPVNPNPFPKVPPSAIPEPLRPAYEQFYNSPGGIVKETTEKLGNDILKTAEEANRDVLTTLQKAGGDKIVSLKKASEDTTTTVQKAVSDVVATYEKG